MSQLIQNKFDLWLKNEWNVLLEGGHGIGKTTLIVEAFERHGLKWQYFSAPTMDPWVDLVGVPKEKRDEEAGISYLELIRPRAFEEDTVEAIFIDEFNRAKPKTTDALMELIQFKSINGRKFHNLKVIWAAINPPDDEHSNYKVEEMDSAQQDRFHIQFVLPSAPDREYFVREYGDRLGNRAVDWWHNTLPDDVKHLCSPRRLDYAVEVYTKGGDVADALHQDVRPKTLRNKLERIATTTSHTERWLVDPEVYIQEVAVRDSNIDPVEAMADCYNCSADLAQALCHHLPAPKLNALASNDTTMCILLDHLERNPSSRKFLTAVTKNALSFVTAQERATQVLKGCDDGLQSVIMAAATEPHNMSAWDNLFNMVESRMADQLVEIDVCNMLIVFLNECPVTVQGKFVRLLLNYVRDEHATDVVAFVNHNPTLICRCMNP